MDFDRSPRVESTSGGIQMPAFSLTDTQMDLLSEGSKKGEAIKGKKEKGKTHAAMISPLTVSGCEYAISNMPLVDNRRHNTG